MDYPISTANIKEITNNNNTNDVLICFSSFNIRNSKTPIFEWENVCQQPKIKESFKKIVFVRDTNYLFYQKGINVDINSKKSLANYLNNKYRIYNLYLCGYSAGGYIALYLSQILNNVKKVYCFAGIADIHLWNGVNNKNPFINETNKDLFDDNNTSLRDHLKNNKIDIMYFYSSKCEADIIQTDVIRNLPNITIIGIKSYKHGHLIHFCDYSVILTEKDNYTLLSNFNNRKYSRNIFSLKINGFKTIKFVFHKSLFLLKNAFNILCYSVKKRTRIFLLKNKDFSIICNNCVGGVIYDDFGVKFQSPTINIYISK